MSSPRPRSNPVPVPGPGSGGEYVTIPAGWVNLDGDLTIPQGACGVVLFAHGSGSSRHSPRNQMVARQLNAAGLGTLLMDLLTPEEEAIELRGGMRRFDIELLSERLVHAIDWLTISERTSALPIGLFGASTGAAAALVAAAMRPLLRAVVSRGGRPDLAGSALASVRAPTLLIVGGDDEPVIALNRQAYAQLTGEKRLDIVSGATHLFEEPGTLEQVASLATEWFLRHLQPPRTPPELAQPQPNPAAPPE